MLRAGCYYDVIVALRTTMFSGVELEGAFGRDDAPHTGLMLP